MFEYIKQTFNKTTETNKSENDLNETNDSCKIKELRTHFKDENNIHYKDTYTILIQLENDELACATLYASNNDIIVQNTNGDYITNINYYKDDYDYITQRLLKIKKIYYNIDDVFNDYDVHNNKTIKDIIINKIYKYDLINQLNIDNTMKDFKPTFYVYSNYILHFSSFRKYKVINLLTSKIYEYDDTQLINIIEEIYFNNKKIDDVVEKIDLEQYNKYIQDFEIKALKLKHIKYSDYLNSLYQYHFQLNELLSKNDMLELYNLKNEHDVINFIKFHLIYVCNDSSKYKEYTKLQNDDLFIEWLKCYFNNICNN